MHFSAQLCGFAFLALHSNLVVASPVANANAIDTDLQIRDTIDLDALSYWTDINFQPSNWIMQNKEPQNERNNGYCYSLKANSARSAKAPLGYKCTIYSDKGCHGWRTKEFNQDGIADFGSKMNNNGEAWRCCKIGSWNGWGYCDAKLNEGTK